jgi:hypothetical protein
MDVQKAPEKPEQKLTPPTDSVAVRRLLEEVKRQDNTPESYNRAHNRHMRS